MKVRAKRKNGEVIGITMVSENKDDENVLSYLWNHDVKRDRFIYRPGYQVLQAKVSLHGR